MADFWQEQSNRFALLHVGQSKRPMGASFHPDGWGLEGVRAFRGRTASRWMLDHAAPRVIEEFKGIASVCAVAIGAPNTDTAWAEWLEALRRESVDFQIGSLSTDVRLQARRPEPDYEVSARGLLWVPLEVFPDPDPEIVSFELGEIEDVCDASARVCRQLANEVLKIRLDAFRGALGLIPPQTEEARPAAWTVTKDWEQEFVPDGSEAQTLRTVPAPENTDAVGPASTEPADPSRTLTSKEAARLLRVSEDTLHRMRKRDEIHMFKVSSRWRVRASEVIRLRQQPKFSTR